MEITLLVITSALSLFAAFGFYKAGSFKARASKQDLLDAGFGWMKNVPEAIGKLIGWLELAGALGLVVSPIAYFLSLEWALWLAVAAAAGLALTMLVAILMHAARNETKYTIKMTAPLFLVSVLIAAGWVSYLAI